MELSSPGAYISILFRWLLAKTGQNQFLGHMTKGIMWLCRVTSDFDFNKGGCVIQIRVDRSSLQYYQPML